MLYHKHVYKAPSGNLYRMVKVHLDGLAIRFVPVHKGVLCTCATGCPDSSYAEGPDARLFCTCWCHSAGIPVHDGESMRRLFNHSQEVWS